MKFKEFLNILKEFRSERLRTAGPRLRLALLLIVIIKLSFGEKNECVERGYEKSGTSCYY